MPLNHKSHHVVIKNDELRMNKEKLQQNKSHQIKLLIFETVFRLLLVVFCEKNSFFEVSKFYRRASGWHTGCMSETMKLC